MSLFIGRRSELEWLDRAIQLSPVAFISGMPGIGKSRLTREWGLKTGRKLKWYSLPPGVPIERVLGGKEGDSLELLLESSAPQWSAWQAVAWEDLHRATPLQRAVLTSFLRNTPSLPSQILMSDEDHSPEFDLSTPRLRLGPLNAEEIEAFARSMIQASEASEAIDLSDLQNMTGGVPLLLALWFQDRRNAPDWLHSTFQSLSQRSRDVLELLSIAPSSLSSRTLKTVSQMPEADLNAALEELKRRHFLEPKDDLYEVPPYLREASLALCDPAKRSEIGGKLLSAGISDSYSSLFLSSRYGSESQLLETAREFPLSRLEALSPNERKNLLASLSQRLEHDTPSSSGKRPENARIALIASRCALLLGDRTLALSLTQRDSLEGRLTDSELELAVEHLRLLNLLGQDEAARNQFSKLRASLRDPWQGTAMIENAVALIQTSPAESEKILRGLIQKWESSNTPRDQALTQEPLATAWFQLARLLDIQQDYSAAISSYERAEQASEKVGQSYFGAVAALNRAWIALKTHEWEFLEGILKRLRERASRFGYRYIQAGVAVMDARRARMHLKPGLAIGHADRALKLLGENAPLIPVLDSYQEKIHALLAAGLRSAARAEYTAMAARCGNHPRVDLIKVMVDADKLTLDTWLDRWDRQADSQALWEIRALRALEMGQDDLTPEQKRRLERSPTGRLALIQASLLGALRNRDLDLARKRVAELERELAELAEGHPEQVASLLVQAELQESADVSSAKLQLARLTGDPEIRWPLNAWIESRASGSNPETHPDWQRSLPSDQARWKHWWQSFYAKIGKSYQLLTADGTSMADAVPTDAFTSGAQLHEELGEVTFKGKKITGFARSHSLRRTLAFLMESAPKTLSKAELTTGIWQESYRPQSHDARIYTTIQRVRELFKNDSVIEAWEDGYRWNPRIPWRLIRSTDLALQQTNRLQSLVLRSFDRLVEQGRPWVSRSELVELTGGSDASVKRELAKLLERGWLVRKGTGRATLYAKK